MGTHGQRVGLHHIALAVDYLGLGNAVVVLGLDDEDFGIARDLIILLAVGHALDQVLEAQGTLHLTDDNGVECVPFTDPVALGNHTARLEEQLGTILDGSMGEHHVGVGILDLHLGHTTNDDIYTILIGYGAQILDLNHTIILRRDVGYCRSIACHTTSMEGTQGQLCTRLTDGLGGDHADSLTTLHHAVRCQVASVALGTNATLSLTSEDGTDLNRLDGRLVDASSNRVGDFLTALDDDFTRSGINHIVNRHAAQDALAQRSDNTVTVADLATNESAQGTTVLLVDDHVVSDVDQTTGQITGVGGLQSGIGKTLAGTVGRDEVLEHRQTLLEVCQNWVLDNLVTAFNARLLRLGHQTTHTGELTNLVLRTTGTRVEHHEYRVEALLVGSNLLHQLVGEFGIDVGPDIDDLVVTLVVGDSTHVIVHLDLLGTGITLSDDFGLAVRNQHVIQVERQTALECHVVTHVLDIVKELSRTGHTAVADNTGDDIAQRLLGNQLVNVTNLVGHGIVEDDAAHRGVLDELLLVLTIGVDHVNNHTDDGMHRHLTLVIGHQSLLGTVELESLALVALAQLGDIVETEYHIL